MSKILFKIISSIPALLVVLSASLCAAQTGQSTADALLRKIPTPEHHYESVAFSPDGQLIAAGRFIWSVADGSIVATILKETEKTGTSLMHLAFSKDGELFAAASYDSEVMLWNVGSWSSHKTLLRNLAEPKDMAFSPDGTKLGIMSRDEVILYDIPSGKVTPIDKYPEAFFGNLSFSPDSRLLVVSHNGVMQVWDIATQKVIKDWRKNSINFFGRLSPDGNHIIAGGGAIYGEKAVRIWDFTDDQAFKEVTSFTEGLFSLAISNSGKLFVVGGGTYGSGDDLGRFSLWDLENPHELGFDSFGDAPIEGAGLAFSPDDRILAVAAKGAILLYDVDRFRGPQVKKQNSPICGDILVEGDKTFITSISKVPGIMSKDFRLPWRLEVTNPDSVKRFAGSPVVFQDWYIESNASDDRARIGQSKSLLPSQHSPSVNTNYIILGYTQNPGWQDTFIEKIYADGTFVATNNSGKCLAYGNVSELKTDFASIKNRLIANGLLTIPKEPLTIGADHFGTAFIELVTDGVHELRTDADSFDLLMKAQGKTEKRKAFSEVYEKEQEFIKSITSAGMRLPPD